MEMVKPKILVLSSSYPKYKGDMNGVFIYNQVSQLKSFYDIHVLTPDYKGALSFEITEGIKIYRHKQFFTKNIELAYGSDILAKIKNNYLLLFVVLFFLLYQFLAIKKIIGTEKIKIIHAHWLIPQGFLAVLYKTLFNRNVKILATIHGADLNSFDNFAGNLLKKFILKRLDALVVVSQPMKDRVMELGYKKDVFVFPDAVDTDFFTPDKKDEKLKIKYDIKGDLLLFVGGLIERKGIRQLIQAMPLIIKDFPDAKLLVVGDGNLKEELIALVTELTISTNVVFAGAIQHNDLPSYFATADLFILPSFSEGWPVVVMEALSCGAAAVVSDIPVFSNHKDKEQLFTIIKKGDPDSVATNVIALLSNREMLNKKKVNVRQYAIDNLDLKVISDNYREVLSEMVE